MFRFPLQRVLDLRAKKEQAAAAPLASARDEAEQPRRRSTTGWSRPRARRERIAAVRRAAGSPWASCRTSAS